MSCISFGFLWIWFTQYLECFLTLPCCAFFFFKLVSEVHSHPAFWPPVTHPFKFQTSLWGLSCPSGSAPSCCFRRQLFFAGGPCCRSWSFRISQNQRRKMATTFYFHFDFISLPCIDFISILKLYLKGNTIEKLCKKNPNTHFFSLHWTKKEKGERTLLRKSTIDLD